MTVAVLGASKKRERYSNKAVLLLREFDHEVIPIHPTEAEIEGIVVEKSLYDVEKPIDVLTVYVGPKFIKELIPDIINKKPNYVIFNPGTESPDLIQACEENNISYIKACTLVLLKTNQFNSLKGE